MKKQTHPTRNGNDMFVISSLIQKAIRRRDVIAYYAANELIPHYRNYLWKRLFTVSAEDCYDMITHRVMELYKRDLACAPNNTKNVAVAVSTLMNARKNRDADYIACNILNSRDILVYYRQRAWRLLIGEAREYGSDKFVEEFVALREADDFANCQSTIFYSKALALLLKVVRYGNEEMFSNEFRFNDNVDLSKYDDLRLRVPDYVFDCHTYIGRARGKTKQDFVIAEQAALNPHHPGEYDNASWEHFFWLCENGFYLDKYTPRPSKERLKELESEGFIHSLFDIL